MKPYWKITFWYLVFGVLWILLSDWVCEALLPDKETLSFFQTIKGWFFVTLSALLIFQLTRSAHNLQEAKEREKLSVFKSTVRGSYHILLNYLNQMQLVTLEAEQSRDFDREIISMSKDISRNAEAELKKLDEIEKVTPENIRDCVFRDSSKP